MEQRSDREDDPEPDEINTNMPKDGIYTHNLRDDIYHALWKHFCGRKPGKGRPPTLPIVNSTNKLLLQLDLLRKEEGSTLDQMTSWYSKLFPTEDINLGRLQHKIEMLLKETCTFVTDADFEGFLSRPVNFDKVSVTLESINLTRSILLDKSKDFIVPEGTVITNGIVLALDKFKSKEGLSFPFVTYWLSVLLNSTLDACPGMSKISYAAGKVLKEIKKLKNSKSKHLEEKLSQPLFPLSTKTDEIQTGVNGNGHNDTTNECMLNMKTVKQYEKERKERNKAIKALQQERDYLEEENGALKLKNSILLENQSTLRLEEKKLTENKAVLDQKISFQLDLISKLKERIAELEQQWEAFRHSKTYKKNTTLNKKLEQSIEQLASVNDERENFKLLNSINSKMETEINALKSEIRDLKTKLKDEQTKKSKVIKKKNNTEKELHLCREQVEFLLQNKENCFEIKLREDGRGRQFTEDVRLTYMALQGDANVSAENSAKVIQIVAKNIFDKDIDIKDLPKSSSALNFQSEAHVISKHQVLEEIKLCKHFTFACDGTSRDKEHYLEQHIVLDNGRQLSLGFSKIASDNSDTLLESCIDVFNELCDVSEDGTVDKEALFKEIIGKLKCLLSDRAEVMKCFDTKFADYKQNLLNDENASTHFVFCNAHFLLGLYSAAEKAIRDIEREEVESGERLGRDSSAAFSNFQEASETAALRLIRLASSAFGPRGDEKSGSRFEWLAFCSKIGIKSQFSSFRTNRFNNVFHNATALLLHKEHIITFLDGYASSSNLKLRSITEDLNDGRIIAIISALSLFHIFFTEPYWSLMKSSKTHGDFPQYVRMMETTLKMWEDEDVDFKSLCSVFDDFNAVIPPDYFTLFASLSKVNKNFRVLVKECQVVFKRQLKDFLDGGVFGGRIDEEVMAILKTCPLTNLTGERLFGDLDFDKKRRRNASLFSSASKIMWKRNKSYRWLTSQTNRTRQRLIARAIKMGPEWRERKRRAQQQVLEKVKQRIAENRKNKLSKEIKAAENKREVIDWVISGGGLCRNKQELDELMKKKNRLKHLQNQIKARKLLYGESINSSGSVNILYRRLLNHLGHNVPESTSVPPPRKKRRCDDNEDDD